MSGSSASFDRIVAAARTQSQHLGAALLGAGLAGPAAAQCTLVSGPSALTCSGCTGNMTFWPKSPMRVYQKGAGGPDRLLVQLNYGNAVFDLSNPASPAFRNSQTFGPRCLKASDHRRRRAELHHGHRGLERRPARASLDGSQRTTEARTSASRLPMRSGPKGSTGVYRSNKGLVVQKTAGNRYIAYGLATGYLWAADVTTLPSWWSIGNISSEQAFASLTSGAGNLQFTEGNGFQYLYWTRGSSVEVADARYPGPSGSITGGYPTWTIPLSDWGRPSGDSSTSSRRRSIRSRPTENLYILGAFHNTIRSSASPFSRSTLRRGSGRRPDRSRPTRRSTLRRAVRRSWRRPTRTATTWTSTCGRRTPLPGNPPALHRVGALFRGVQRPVVRPQREPGREPVQHRRHVRSPEERYRRLRLRVGRLHPLRDEDELPDRPRAGGRTPRRLEHLGRRGPALERRHGLRRRHAPDHSVRVAPQQSHADRPVEPRPRTTTPCRRRRDRLPPAPLSRRFTGSGDPSPSARSPSSARATGTSLPGTRPPERTAGRP